jgi:prepilin-type N-terminal cleavage/methylation domain-containing protein
MTARRTLRRGFSLIELLLSVFILAIGIISISALFPAGIAQQQQSADDQLGPVIADHALSLLRSRVGQQDFGTFEEFGIGGAPGSQPQRLFTQSVQGGNASYVFRPRSGDWSWVRPGVIRLDQVGDVGINLRGAIDIFSALAQQDAGSTRELCELPAGIPTLFEGVELFGAPYNSSRSVRAPAILVTQRERWWPTIPEQPLGLAGNDLQQWQAAEAARLADAPPTYAWECMFRRNGGTVQVAIFVFRYVGRGGVRKPFYAVDEDGGVFDSAVTAGGYPNLPGFPYRRVLVAGGAGLSAGAATTGPAIGNQLLVGWQQPDSIQTNVQTPFSTGLVSAGTAAAPGGAGQGLLPTDIPQNDVVPVHHQWQLPAQWIVDNNGNVHKVARGRRSWLDAVQVRFAAPVPRTPNAQVYDDYELEATAGGDPVRQGIRTFHYVPNYVDAEGTQLVPVYATVRNL